MAIKIYKKGAYVVINDNGKLTELNSAEVSIKKAADAIDIYEVMHFGVSKLKAQLADIQNEAGDVYAEATWDAFRYESTGYINSGAVTGSATGTTYDPTDSGLAATTVQAAVDEVAGVTTVVNISSAQILTMGTIPILLLPALINANEYYEFERIIFEFNQGSTSYDLGAMTYLMMYDEWEVDKKYIDSGLINQGVDSIAIIDNSRIISTTANSVINGFKSLPSTLYQLTSDSNPTLGDGTLRVIITYTVRTFGA